VNSLTDSLRQFEASSLLALKRAAERETNRRAAATSLIAFTEFTFPRYQAVALHRQIAEHLERVARGEVDRLMLLVPPRHGKSELASRRFPAWYLGRHPERQFISASASATLSEDFGRDVRNLIASPEYAEIFGTRLAEDSQARGRWQTDEGGSYYAVGVGGAIMGRGAHVALIDDPFGSMADARSEQVRKSVHEWYRGSLYNRLEHKGAIIVIAHRMHQDDLSGMLLAQQAAGGDKWTVVELKALAPDGSALWPEKFDADALARIKANVSAKDWTALYQQEPTAETGSFFREEWIKPIIWPHGAPPPFMRTYGATDFAMTASAGDYTVHCILGIDVDQRMHLVDLWRAQATPKESVEAMCDMIKKWKPAWWAQERVHIVSGIGPYLETRMHARQAYCAQELFVARHDKAVRSQSIRGRMELGGLYVRADAPWVADLKSELLAFPDGRHDDIVDCLGLCGQLMDRFAPGVRPSPPEVHPWNKAYRAADDEEMRIPSFMTL
jgi:predicted phage terminase large subunit-like protein